VGRSLRRRCLEEPDQLADRVVAVLGMAKRELAVELVLVAASVTRPRDVAGRLEVGDDVRRASLSDSDCVGDISQSQRWVGCYARKHVGVVRHEAPQVVLVTRICIQESVLL
jgi:hypothetical protein